MKPLLEELINSVHPTYSVDASEKVAHSPESPEVEDLPGNCIQCFTAAHISQCSSDGQAAHTGWLCHVAINDSIHYLE